MAEYGALSQLNVLPQMVRKQAVIAVDKAQFEQFFVTCVVGFIRAWSPDVIFRVFGRPLHDFSNQPYRQPFSIGLTLTNTRTNKGKVSCNQKSGLDAPP